MSKLTRMRAGPVSFASFVSSARLVGVLAIAACSSEPSAKDVADRRDPNDAGGDANTANGLPCDVARVLRERCGTCHGESPQHGAPRSFVTYEDLHALSDGRPVYELVGERIHDDRDPMPPPPNARLSTEEARILDAWIGEGAPSAETTCEDPKGDDAGAPTPSPLGCEPDLEIRAKTAYTMSPKAVDQYVCVGVDVDNATKRHVTAFAAHVDNAKILHHVLLFQAPTSVSPTPTPCSSFGSVAWQLVAGWAPGSDPFELPAEAGFPQEKGTTHWVIQLHYNNAQGLEGQTDRSGFDLCTTDELRPHDAGLVGFGGTKFDLPPRAKTTVTCDYTLPEAFDGVTFLRAWPHMHTLGAALKSERLVGGDEGNAETIVNDPNFNFQSQLSHPVTMKVATNDVVRTSCTWDNTTDKRVRFGERTGDEMCFNFVTYYPLLASTRAPGGGFPAMSWITPAESANCR